VTGTGKAIPEEEILDFFYSELGIDDFQLVERKPGQFDLMLVAAPGQTLDIESIQRTTSDLLDGPPRLDIFPAQTIYPEATGKFRFVKSASYEDFH